MKSILLETICFAAVGVLCNDMQLLDILLAGSSFTKIYKKHDASSRNDVTTKQTMECHTNGTLNGLLNCACAAAASNSTITSFLGTTETLVAREVLRHYQYAANPVTSETSRQQWNFTQRLANFIWHTAHSFDKQGGVLFICKEYEQLGNLVQNYRKGHSPTAKMTTLELQNSIQDIQNFVYLLYSAGKYINISFVVLCSKSDTDSILQVASMYDLLSLEQVWILLHRAHIKQNEIIKNALSIRAFSKTNRKTALMKYTTYIRNVRSEEYPRCFNAKILRRYPESVAKTSESLTFSPPEYDDGLIFKMYSLNNKKQWYYTGFSTAKEIRLRLEAFSTFPRVTQHQTIKVVVALDPPHIFLHSQGNKGCANGLICWSKLDNASDPTTRPLCCVGLVIDILMHLKNVLLVDFHMYLVKDNIFGRYDPKKKVWNGLIYDILTKKADIAVGGISLNSERKSVVDFTESYMIESYAILLSTSIRHNGLLNFDFTMHLKWELWTSILAAIILSSFILLVLLKKRGLNIHAFLVSDVASFFVGLTFQRDLGSIPPSRGFTNLFRVVFATTTMIIMSTYTAVMTASKVAPDVLLPITGLYDTKIQEPTHAFKFGTLGESAITDFFINNAVPNFKRIYRFMENYNFYDTKDAIKRLSDGRLDALIQTRSVLQHYSSRDPFCRMTFVGKPLFLFQQAFPVRKGSPLKEKFSYQIRKMKVDGVVERLMRKWTSKRCSTGRDKITSTAQNLTISTFSGLIVILGGVCVFSFIILIIEGCCRRSRAAKC